MRVEGFRGEQILSRGNSAFLFAAARAPPVAHENFVKITKIKIFNLKFFVQNDEPKSQKSV